MSYIKNFEIINGTMDREGAKITFWYQYKALWGNNPIPELNETPAYILNFIRNGINEKVFDAIQEGFKGFSFDNLNIQIDKIENEYNRIIEGTYSLKDLLKAENVKILFDSSMYYLNFMDDQIVLNDYLNQHYDFHELEITNGCFMDKLIKFVKNNLDDILENA